jgi:magnesium-transporting ATPase (P-type)
VFPKGDGANDEEMIIRADVGVGIAGLEVLPVGKCVSFVDKLAEKGLCCISFS